MSLATIALASWPAASGGQVCGHWRPEAGPPGVTGHDSTSTPPIQTAAAWDPDGPGPATEVVVVGGDFRFAGSTNAFKLAIWDGDTWRAFPASLAGLRQLATFRGDLFAATHREIYRWTDDRWTIVGSVGVDSLVGRIDVLKVIGDALYVGGAFNAIDGIASSSLVIWDGGAWRDAAAPDNASISAVTSDGTILVIAGTVTGSAAPLVASRPLGSSVEWTSLVFDLHAGVGVFAELHDVAFHNGSLYAAGRFAQTSTRISSVARLAGNTWTHLDGASGYAYQLLSHQGELLVAGAIGAPIPFSRVGHPGGVMRLGADDRWRPVGGGVGGAVHVAIPKESELLAFGDFIQAEQHAVQNAARWSGQAWHPLGRGVAHPVAAITAWTDRLVVGGGQFVSVETPDGWRTLGDPFFRTSSIDGPVNAVAAVGNELFVAGTTCVGPVADLSCPTGVLRWNGSAWEPLPGDPVTFSRVNVLHNHLGNLIVAGPFVTTTLPPLAGVARWDGAAWHALSSGLVGPVTASGLAAPPDVRAVISFASELIVAGAFATAGGRSARNIARWNGVEWQALGEGLPNRVDGLTVLDDRLYASVSNIGLVRWTGAAWETVPTNPVTGHYSGRLVTHQGEIVRAGSAYGQTMILSRGDWRALGHFNGGSPPFIESLNGELLIGTTEIARHDTPSRGGFLARWSAGGTVPTRYTITAPAVISIRRGGPFSQQVLQHDDPALGVRLVRDGFALPTMATDDGSPWLGYPWSGGSDPRVGFNLRNAQPEHAGEYRFQLSNACGTVQSAPFRVTIRCGGDFDGDNAVSSADLFAYLNAYFNLEFDALHGPFNRVEELSVADLFAFLTDYLTPCP